MEPGRDDSRTSTQEEVMAILFWILTGIIVLTGVVALVKFVERES